MRSCTCVRFVFLCICARLAEKKGSLRALCHCHCLCRRRQCYCCFLWHGNWPKLCESRAAFAWQSCEPANGTDNANVEEGLGVRGERGGAWGVRNDDASSPSVVLVVAVAVDVAVAAKRKSCLLQIHVDSLTHTYVWTHINMFVLLLLLLLSPVTVSRPSGIFVYGRFRNQPSKLPNQHCPLCAHTVRSVVSSFNSPHMVYLYVCVCVCLSGSARKLDTYLAQTVQLQKIVYRFRCYRYVWHATAIQIR